LIVSKHHFACISVIFNFGYYVSKLSNILLIFWSFRIIDVNYIAKAGVEGMCWDNEGRCVELYGGVLGKRRKMC
jgi:hypothetical protein